MSASAEPTVAILAYHKVGEPPGGWATWFYISEAAFDAQLAYLRERGWRALDRDAFLAGIASPERLPERSVLITFDDGYRSNLQVAAPILRKHDVPAVVFVPTDFIGGYNAFDADPLHEPREEICTFGELQELEALGISVESHGASHRAFSQLPAAELESEIVRSKKVLEDALRKDVRMLSFPFGDNGAAAQTGELLAQCGYEAAFLYGGAPGPLRAAGRFSLPRVAVGADTDVADVLATA